MTQRSSAFMAVAVAALTCAVPAMADIRQLAASGRWSAYGGTGDDNRPLCGVGTEGAEGRRILIQQSAGNTGIELLLKKDSWDIPANTPVTLQVQFDARAPVPMQATGSGHQIVVNMPFDQSLPFMHDLRADRQIRVFFLSGNETPWTGGLSGSGSAIAAFNTCRGGLMPAEGPTQPFSPAPSMKSRP
jgi:hypothetical protein